MKPEEILSYCIENFEDTVLVKSFGEKALFYNPNNALKRGIYILTVKEKDGNNDKTSKLDRTNIYRVNLGVRKNTFIELFEMIPKRPIAGDVVNINYDFTCVDQILPHPVYAWMSWICVLNPSPETFENLKPLIQESYDYAKEKFKKKKIENII